MNPEDLKKQAEDEGVVHNEDVAPPMPCGDGCEGCPDCATPDTSEDVPPEIEQPTDTERLIPGLKEAKAKAEEPEVRQAPPEDDPQLQEEEILQGFVIELTKSGEVRRNFYGESQNITLMLGLAKIMELEIEQRQKLQRGFIPSAELTALGGIAKVIQNMGMVLIQMQGAMSQMNETMKAGFDEDRQVESTVDAESQQE